MRGPVSRAVSLVWMLESIAGEGTSTYTRPSRSPVMPRLPRSVTVVMYLRQGYVLPVNTFTSLPFSFQYQYGSSCSSSTETSMRLISLSVNSTYLFCPRSNILRGFPCVV